MRQIAVFFLCALSACGGGGGGAGGGPPGPTNSAPNIANLSFGPTIVEAGIGGGVVTINGTFDFTDADGNLSSLTLTVLADGGQTIDTQTIDVVGAAGLKQGTIAGQIDVGTATVGDFTVRVYVTDSGGLRSNTLQGLFRVVEPAWVSRTPMPTPRPGFATATLGSVIYVLGGRDASAPIIPQPPVATVEIYHPATDTWSTAPSMLVAVSEQMAAVVNGKIYVIGGNTEFGQGSDAVQEYDPTTQTWSLKSSLAEPRYSAATAVHDGLIYVAGGQGPGVTYSSLLWYDPLADNWAAGAPMSDARSGAGGAVVDGRFIVYGGYSPGYGDYRRLVESYDPVMDMWSLRANGEPRQDCGIALQNGMVYTFGGHNSSGGQDSNQVYDNASNVWLVKQSMPISLHFARAESINDKVYVFDSNNTLEYTPANDQL